MMQRSFLFLILLLLPSLFYAQEEQGRLIGSWSGDLETPQGSLRILFHFERAERAYSGTMDSPDQGAEGIAIDSVERKGDSLFLRIERIAGSYEGELIGSDSLDGEWSQGGMSYPLDLSKGEAEDPDRRPQTPKPPYPYRVIDTNFQQEPEGFRLAGTITLPEGKGPFPGVVLVSGSGPQDRDESIMGHKPFHVIADRLTRNGFAVLRYDDRGTASSEGDFAEGTLDRFTDDARSAFEHLRGREDVADDRVGMLGHSEGGMVVSQLAAEDERVAFLILLASPALPGDSILFAQNRAILTASGMSEELVNGQIRLLDSLFTFMREDRDSAYMMERSEEMVHELFGESYSEELLEQIAQRYQAYLLSEWFHAFIEKDPREDLRELEIPVLALFGENDLQVLAEANAKAMRQALEGNDEARIETIEGVNHLFQPDESGLPSNYGRIRTSIHPPVLELKEEWLKRK